MRRILIDHATRKNAKKRGGDRSRLSLDVAHVAATANFEQVLAIDEAITALEHLSPRGRDRRPAALLQRPRRAASGRGHEGVGPHRAARTGVRANLAVPPLECVAARRRSGVTLASSRGTERELRTSPMTDDTSSR